jgi:integrase
VLQAMGRELRRREQDPEPVRRRTWSASRRRRRTLPLFGALADALEALYKLQLAEARAAGPAYAVEVDDGYVCADELGASLHPERYSDEFARLCRRAGLRRIRLHDCWATMDGILELAGVPDSVRASWLGHSIQVKPAELSGQGRGPDTRQ